MEAAWWPSIADTLMAAGVPWPEAAVLMDLRWWDDHSRMNKRDMRPGRPTLCRRWGWTERAARAVMADREGWADPAKPDMRPANVQPMSSQRPAGVQPVSSFRAESDALMHPSGQPVSSACPAHVQPMSSERPHARNTQSTDTDTATDTRESTSDSACAEPPAAGAAQLSLLGAEPELPKGKPAKPTKAAREVEAAAVLFARLERLRLERYQRLGRTVRGLSAEAWVPKLRKALAKTTAGDIEDGWVWLLRHPDAAWHRGEDRGGSDRCVDFAMLLAHPEYGARRTWSGLTGLTTIEQEEVAAWLASGGRSADAPAWRDRMRAAGVAVPLSTEEDDELWNGIGSAGSPASPSPAADKDDGYVCPF